MITDRSSNMRMKSYRYLNLIKKNREIYLLAIPVIAYFLIFCYGPMYGAIIAFKQYSPGKGIWGSKWVGFKNFEAFFKDVYFMRTLRNTLIISFLDIIFGFPAPIILALMMNELRSRRYQKVVQTITYMPHFISTVVVCGMLVQFCSLSGIFNDIVEMLGGKRVSMLMQPSLFRTIYIGSGIWQQTGWNSIVYLAALTAVDVELYDAAKVDGANKWNQTIHVTLPCIMPTIIIMLILKIGKIMNVGFEKIMLLYNPSTYETGDVISSYAYRKGLEDFNYSYSTTISLFNSIVNFILVIGANTISRRVNETSLW